MVRGSKITAKVLLQRVQRPSGSAGVLCCSSRFCCVLLCCEAQSDRKPTTCLQQHSTQLLEAFVTLEGHMTQEEVCSSVSNHGESRKSCQKRTRPPPNGEHQTVSPAALELLAEMEPWLWILLAALCFGRYQTTTRCHCLTLEARTVCVRCGNSLSQSVDHLE